MAYSLNLKITVSGKSIEINKYRKSILRDYRAERDKPEPRQLDAFEEQTRKELNKKLAYNRARTKIKRLVNANLDLNKFFTLTFAENITDKTKANYLFNQFIKRLTYQFPSFVYLAVPERQKRGAVHYHLICNLDFIEFDSLRKIWGHGRLEVKDIRSVRKTGAYISKYLTKSSNEFCKKSFFCSRKIKRPIEIMGRQAEIFENRFLSEQKPIFEKSFFSIYTGVVEYSEYSLDSAPFPTGKFDRSMLLERNNYDFLAK